jgi:hypothetical protein
MHGRITLLLGLIIVVVALTLGQRRAEACAPAPPANVHVAIAAESAIIVWDEATKTEHFIRRASFRSQTPSFGFLVPTPTKPELAEADDKAFADLEETIKPEIKRPHEWRLAPTAFACFFLLARKSETASAPSLLSPPPVRVLETKRIGDYDAVVLEADDAGALGEWLNSHGYAKQPALEEWLQPYVAKKWKLTAFKIADDVANAAADAGAEFGIKLTTSTFGTRAIRMSFKTERPFFPYREPRDQRDSSMPASLSSTRSLRVFYVGPKRVDPLIGEGATKFPGKIAWAGQLPQTMFDKLPVGVLAGSWLTAIEDDSAPRPGVDELWLDPSRDQTVIKPPPIIQPIYDEIPLPLDVITLFGIAIYFIVRRIRRKRAAAPEA